MNIWSAHVFLSTAQRRLFARGLPIFMLHKVAAPPSRTRDPFDYLSPESLDAKLGALRCAGLRSLPLDAFLQGDAAMANGFVVTFDDGYRNVWQNALPILAKHEVKAVQFLVAGKLGQQNDWDIAGGEVAEPLMDEAQVRDWLAAGHSIGSHGLNHRILKKLTPNEAREEIAGSRKRLEDTFAAPVRHFCYPSGRYNPEVLDMVRQAGYQTASTVEFGVNATGQSRFELRRISPLTATELLAKACHRLGRRIRGR